MKPWVRIDKSRLSSVGAALQREYWGTCFAVVPPLWGSINVLTIITQGLRPGLCRSIALKGSSTSFQSLYCFDAVTLLRVVARIALQVYKCYLCLSIIDNYGNATHKEYRRIKRYRGDRASPYKSCARSSRSREEYSNENTMLLSLVRERVYDQGRWA